MSSEFHPASAVDDVRGEEGATHLTETIADRVERA
jgi:hypothetical protein